jgi:Fe-S-cluster-containing hydrogenase component 2
MPTFIPGRCPQNHPCPLVAQCPVGAISQTGFRAPVIDAEKCIECGVCAVSCGYGAVVEGAAGASRPVST